MHFYALSKIPHNTYGNIILDACPIVGALLRPYFLFAVYGHADAAIRKCLIRVRIPVISAVRNGPVRKDALEILKEKKKGGYCVLQIDPAYKPADLERKQVFGVTFEQGHNFIQLNDECLKNIVTQNKTLSKEERDNLLISLIILKYTQSNSVCYVKDGQAIGIGAGQQSRIHCTRLAGDKADKWWLRQSPQVLNLPFKSDIKRADRDNTIDVYTSDDYDDVLAEGVWQNFFTQKPAVFTKEERKAWIAKNTDVAVGSDAFFPFGDNIERAHRSGAKVIAQPGGSIRDDNVIQACDKYGMVMAFTGVRLFHH